MFVFAFVFVFVGPQVPRGPSGERMVETQMRRAPICSQEGKTSATPAESVRPSLPKLAQQPKEAKMQEVKQAAIAFTQSYTVFVTILQLSIFHTIATAKVLQKPVKSN